MNLEFEELKKTIIELGEDKDKLKEKILELKETIENYEIFSKKIEEAYNEAYNKLNN